jgi:hypothetical protein
MAEIARLQARKLTLTNELVASHAAAMDIKRLEEQLPWLEGELRRCRERQAQLVATLGSH